jgi:hypothetical protein
LRGFVGATGPLDDDLRPAIAQEPEAKRVLLTAYADTDAAIKAINDYDRLRRYVVGHGPVALPHVDHEIEPGLGDVHLRDLSALDPEDDEFDRCSLASRRLEAHEVAVVLPVEVDDDETATTPIGVNGDVLVD